MNVFNFLTGKTEEDIPSIRSFLFKNYIKTVIVNDDDNIRIMFIGNRTKSDFNNPISFECNGIIFKYDKQLKVFSPLVIPVELFNGNRNISSSEINNNIVNNNYELYKVYDGTVINLYYYNNSWRISTNKSFDATNLNFVKGTTYSQAFEEISTYYPEFNINNLDTCKCYTINMKYYKVHPFIEHPSKNPNHLILLRTVDLKNMKNISYSENVGLPTGEKFILNENDNYNSITNTLNKEIQKFKKSYNNPNYSPIFGLILRSNNFNKTGEYSNILLESNLLSKIRNFCYNHLFINKLDFYDKLASPVNQIVNKDYYDIQDIVNLKIFIINKDIPLYLTLFPQYRQLFTNFNNTISFITAYIYSNYHELYSNLPNLADLIKHNKQLTLQNQDNNIYNVNKLNILSLIIINDMRQKNVNINCKNGDHILYDFLFSYDYIDYYYSYIFK